MPSIDDPQYTKIERLIERTLHPYVTLDAVSAKGSSAELRELVRLGYLRRASEGYFPTAYARKVAVYDTWPTELGGPFHLMYENGEYITFTIGTYSVRKLTSVAHFDGAPCGAYGDERDEYGFKGTLKLNRLGLQLLHSRLLYTKPENSVGLVMWDGRRSVDDIWSNSSNGGSDDYKYVRSRGETVNFKSTLARGA